MTEPTEPTFSSSTSQSPSQSLGRTIGYWLTTSLVAFALGPGGVADLMRVAPVVKGMEELGYPSYVCLIIGVWKVLGTIVLLAPGLPLLKEWAYAGAVFDLTGASASHFAVGDPAAKVIIPLVITGLTMASWALRPASRRLPCATCCGKPKSP